MSSICAARQSYRHGASSVIQRGAAAVFMNEGACQVEETLDHYRVNAHVIKDGLEAAGYWVYDAVNGPYAWCRTPDDMSSWDFFQLLLERANVIITPGAGLGPSGEGCVRLTAFGDAVVTVEAIERIKAL